MRYVIATVIAGLSLSAGWFFVWHTKESSSFSSYSEFLRAKEIAETRNIEPDPDTAARDRSATEMPNVRIIRLRVADLLLAWWFIWIILVCGGSFGFAHWMSLKAPQQESQR